MEKNEKLRLLRDQALFENIRPDVLDPILELFVPRALAKGETLWREGAPANKFTFMVRGKIKIVKYRADGGEAILGVFDEGDAVGQIAVFRKMPYPATAIAIEDGLCLEIFRDHFFGTLQKNEQLLGALIEGMMARNHDLVKRVEELTTSSAEQRLAMHFQALCEKHGRRTTLEDGRMGIALDLSLSRKDIADLINVRVETAIRLMSRWNKVGPVRTVHDGFLVTHCEMLELIAAGDDL